jgi:nucleoside-diphosphate-sugar epimerase
MKALVTGASGFIGSYLVTELTRQGHQVTALCQPGSSINYLNSAGVIIAIGDVTEPKSLQKPCENQDCIFHCAAIVGGYGNWDRYFRVGVVGTRNIINAAANAGVERFVHLSSISVYGTRPEGKRYDESTPFETNPEPWNHYVRQKVLSEMELWKAHNEGRIRAIAIRPSLVLGPRDRNVVRRSLNIVRSPLGAIVGEGTNRVPCVVIDDVVSTTILSATKIEAIGKAYNLCGAKPITQSEYMGLHSAAAGLPPHRRKMPLRLAHVSCAAVEGLYRLARRQEEPFCTRIALAFAANDFNVDCSLAMMELGWRGESSYEDAIYRSVEWYLKFGR